MGQILSGDNRPQYILAFMLTEDLRKIVLKFVRGETSIADFEAWLYHDETLERAVGSEFHLDIISCNFRNKHEVFFIKKRLRELAIQRQQCWCEHLCDMDALGFAGEEIQTAFWDTVTRFVVPQDPQWWRYVSKCSACQTCWLVAQEEVFNDICYLERISDDAANRAQNGHWPARFETYPDVLSHGSVLGIADPLEGPIQVKAAEMLEKNPNVSAETMGNILGLRTTHAEILIEKIRTVGTTPSSQSQIDKPA